MSSDAQLTDIDLYEKTRKIYPHGERREHIDGGHEDDIEEQVRISDERMYEMKVMMKAERKPDHAPKAKDEPRKSVAASSKRPNIL